MKENILKKFFTKEYIDFILFNSKIISCNQGDYVFRIGDHTTSIYIVNSGKLKVAASVMNNPERIIRIVTDQEIIGHRGFGGTWRYTVSAIALEKCELLEIPLKIFDMAFRTHPDFAYFMMIFFADELRQSEEFVLQLPIRNVIASVLYTNLKTFGYAEGSSTMLSYTPSRKDLASQAGTRYETIVRTLADFNNEKIIKTDRKTIHILDEHKLFELKEGLR